MSAAGRRDKRLTILAPNRTPGFKNIVNYVELKTVWGWLNFKTTNDKTRQVTIEADIDAEMGLEYSTILKSDYKIKYRGKIYNIIGEPMPDEKNKETVYKLKNSKESWGYDA